MNIGSAIKEIRTKKKLKANELAERIGITPSSLSSIENGHVTPSKETVESAARVFGIEVDLIYMLATDLDKDMSPEVGTRFKNNFPNFRETILSFIE